MGSPVEVIDSLSMMLKLYYRLIFFAGINKGDLVCVNFYNCDVVMIIFVPSNS